jgi:HSP20 family protein
VDRKDIDVTVEENVLTIRAEVSEESEQKEDGYLLRERHSGSFYRAVRLPDSVDSEKAESSYKDGVLTIRLPKQEEKKARKLTVGTT